MQKTNLKKSNQSKKTKDAKIKLISIFKFALIGVASFVLIFIAVKAAPPLSPYSPGETVDPVCSSITDANCTITTPAVSGSNSDITSLSGLTTALSAGQGGTGLSTIAANKLLYSSALNTFASLSLDSTLGISSGILSVQDNSITGAKIALGSDTTGDIMYYNGTDWARLGVGTSGQYLKTQGYGTNPAWATLDNIPGNAIANNALDWSKFNDAMTLDATTAIDMAAGDLNFGSGILYVDNAGRVGVGTTNPSIAIPGTSLPKLEIASAGVSGPRLRLKNNDATSNNNNLDFTGAGGFVGSLFSDVSGNGGTDMGLGTGLSGGNLRFYSGEWQERLRINSSGSVGIGTATPLTKLDVAGSARVKGTATSVLTGTIDPAASTTVTGVGTAFTTQLVVGDRITVTGETRTVTAIASATSLTVDTAFSDNANDTSPDKLAAEFIVKDSDDNVDFVVSDQGYVGIGTASPSDKLEIESGNPTKIVSVIDAVNLNRAHAVDVDSKRVYVASPTAGTICAFDASVVENLSLISCYKDLDKLVSPYWVKVIGKYAYAVGYSSDNLVILDVSNPSSITYVGSYASSTYLDGAYKVVVVGKYAYVSANSGKRFTIIDISNPANPTLTGSLYDAVNFNGINDIYVRGKYAYTAGEGSGTMAIVDISDPTNPNIISTYTNLTYTAGLHALYVSGKYAYLDSKTAKTITILDVSNPAATPTYVGSYYDASLDESHSIEVYDKYVYVNGYEQGKFLIIDVSNPANPTLKGVYQETGWYPTGFTIKGNIAYIAAWNTKSLTLLRLPGANIPMANIGNIQSEYINVLNNLDVNNSLFVGNGINISSGGLQSNGPSGFFGNSTLTALTVAQNSTGDIVNFKDGATNVFTVRDGGNVGIGTTNPARKLSVVNGDIDQISYLNSSSSWGVVVEKARGTAESPLIVQNGDQLGLVAATGYDGSGFVESANIHFEVDGTPGANNIPGMIQFNTAGGTAEKMRITNSGNVGIGTANPVSKLDVNGGIRADMLTSDPCGGTDFPEGTIFYNDTSDYYCFCNGGGNDVQMHSPLTACF